LAAKIRDAQLRKIPYMLVVGQREKETSTVSVRLHTMQNIGAQSIECFIKDAQKAVSEKIAF
jgi:threonyl-tRNA synthetase